MLCYFLGCSIRHDRSYSSLLMLLIFFFFTRRLFSPVFNKHIVRIAAVNDASINPIHVTQSLDIISHSFGEVKETTQKSVKLFRACLNNLLGKFVIIKTRTKRSDDVGFSFEPHFFCLNLFASFTNGNYLNNFIIKNMSTFTRKKQYEMIVNSFQSFGN